MDIKTFINQQIEKAEAEKEKLIEISGWDRFCPECETSYLEYEFFGKIEAYKNVLEFLEKRKGNKEYINDFMQSLSILSTSPEYEKIENLFTEMDLEKDILIKFKENK